MDTIKTVLGLMLVGAVVGVVAVLAADPACGPDGDSQHECAAEVARDLTGGR